MLSRRLASPGATSPSFSPGSPSDSTVQATLRLVSLEQETSGPADLMRRCTTVDANVMGIVTQCCLVGKDSDELASQRESGTFGKEPRHNRYVSSSGDGQVSEYWKVSHMYVCFGDTSRSTIVPACSPQYFIGIATRGCSVGNRSDELASQILFWGYV